MIKKAKKSFLAILAFLAATCITSAVSFLDQSNYRANAENSEFKMVSGVTIRKSEDSTGLRFKATFGKSIYNEVESNENKEFGFVISNAQWVKENVKNGDYINELGEENCILIKQSSENGCVPYIYDNNGTLSETDDIYALNGVVTDIKYSHTNWEWFGVAVIITTTDGVQSYEYASFNEGDNVGTLLQAATNDILTLGEPTEVLSEYVYRSVAVTEGKTETEYLAMDTDAKKALLAMYTMIANESLGITIGTTKMIDGKAVAENGNSIEVATKWESSDEKVATVDEKGVVTAVGRGYAIVTGSNPIMGTKAETIIHTGETTLVGASNELIIKNGYAAQTDSKEEHTIADRTAYGISSFYFKDEKTAFYTSTKPTVGKYYLDAMIEEGYQYICMPMFFEANDVEGNPIISNQTFRYYASKGFMETQGGTAAINKECQVPLNEWIYMYLPLNSYNEIMSYGAGIDSNGMFVAGDIWNNVSFILRPNASLAGVTLNVHYGEMTLEKEAKINITENNVDVKIGEELALDDKFSSNKILYYMIAGEEVSALLVEDLETEVTIKANVWKISAGEDCAPTSIAEITEQRIIVADLGIEVASLTLVDLEKETLDIPSILKESEFAARGYTLTYEIVKEYSDGTAISSIDTTTCESGLYHINAIASKTGSEIKFRVTLDLYRKSEGCEYESFNHSDSKYAVSVQYYVGDAKDKTISGVSAGEMLYTRNYQLIDLANGAKSDYNVDLTGKVVEVAYSETQSETAGSWWLDSTGDIDYLMVNLYLDTATMKSMNNDTAKSFTHVYVTPRHSKEYYEMWKAVGIDSMEYKYQESNSGQSYHLTKVEAEGIDYAKIQGWGSVYQYSVKTAAKNSRRAGSPLGPMSIDDLIAYYDNFDNGTISIWGGYNIQATNYTWKLSSISFVDADAE